MITRNNLDFSNQTIFVALDVHAKSWSVQPGLRNTALKGFTQPPDAQVLYKYLSRTYPKGHFVCAYEAGFSGFSTYDQLTDLGMDCLVVHPADIPRTDKDRVRKTDKSDSWQLLRMLQAGQLQSIHVPPRCIRDVTSIVRWRTTVVKNLSRTRVQIRSHLHLFGIKIPSIFPKGKWSRAFVQWLEQQVPKMNYGGETLEQMLRMMHEQVAQLKSVNRKIYQYAQSSSFKELVCLLRSIPGVGLLTAMKLATEVGTIERFTSCEKFACYAGLVPIVRNSGEMERQQEMTYRGNKILRKALVESAWVAKRMDPVLALKYQEGYQRTQNSKKAIVIVARLLLNRIYAVWKRGTPYEKGVA